MSQPQRKPPASLKWINESGIVGDEEVLYQPRFADPESGVEPLRLTSLPAVNTHIYPEAPVSTRDGRLLVWCRFHPATDQRTYWVADLETLRIRQITDEPDAWAPVVAPDGQWLYYSSGRYIWRLHPQSFERELFFEIPQDVGGVGPMVTISACGTRLAGPAMPSPAATERSSSTWPHGPAAPS